MIRTMMVTTLVGTGVLAGMLSGMVIGIHATKASSDNKQECQTLNINPKFIDLEMWKDTTTGIEWLIGKTKGSSNIVMVPRYQNNSIKEQANVGS